MKGVKKADATIDAASSAAELLTRRRGSRSQISNFLLFVVFASCQSGMQVLRSAASG
jgi:hypothetical protein